jgi:general secretion pathway protein C
MNAASWLEGLPAHDRWRALLMSEGPRVATWVLGLALGVQAALIVTDLASAGRRGAPPAAAPSAGARPFAMRSRSLDVAGITNAHLFGRAPPKEQDGANAPQTSIPLVLTGTIAGDDPQNGLAILGQTAQTAKVYAVGDSVPGAAKLHSVYNDRVVIDRGGELESLALPRKVSGSAPPPAAALPDNSSLERMRRMITEQPGLITDIMRPQPVMEHGHMNGFRVYPGRNRQAFMRLGLRPGDQVTAINGTPLDDRDRGEQILHTLASSSEARVTVIRGGVTEDLNLNIAQVAQEAETVAAQSAAQSPLAGSPLGQAPPAQVPPAQVPPAQSVAPQAAAVPPPAEPPPAAAPPEPPSGGQ